MEFHEDRQPDPIFPESGIPVTGDDPTPEPEIIPEPEVIPEPEIIPEPEHIPEPEFIPEPEEIPEPAFEWSRVPQPEEFTVPRRRVKKSGGFGKKLLAGVLTAALVIGSCALTANLVNSRWEDRMQQHQEQMDAHLADLQEQIAALGQMQTGVSISGSPVSTAESLSPSQVYAMNVNSVVAISNQTTTYIWGQVSETASSGTGFIISADG